MDALYENWIAATIDDFQMEVEENEAFIEMQELEEKEHQYLLWLEATVNEFQQPVVERAKMRLLELGLPPYFQSPCVVEGVPTLARQAFCSLPHPLMMEIYKFIQIIEYGCLLYCLYPDAP